MRDGRNDWESRTSNRVRPEREGAERKGTKQREREAKGAVSFQKMSCCQASLSLLLAPPPPLYPVRHVCQPRANLLPTARPALSLYPADATQSSLTDSRHRASTHPACEEGVAGPDTRGRSTHRDVKYSDNFHHPCVSYPHPQVSEKQTHFPLLR